MRSQHSWSFDARFLGGVALALLTPSRWRSPYAAAAPGDGVEARR